MKNKVFIVLLCLFTVIFIAGCKKDGATNPFDEKVNVKIDIENYGTISLELYPDLAPKSVERFLYLVDEGYYNGLTFHRIMDGFMIQGGESAASSELSTIKGEFEANGFKNELKHERGVIAMARRGDSYDSATAQFFIVQTTTPSIDGYYATFGRVTDGIEIVDKICKDTKVEDDNGTVLKENQPIITKIYRAN